MLFNLRVLFLFLLLLNKILSKIRIYKRNAKINSIKKKKNIKTRKKEEKVAYYWSKKKHAMVNLTQKLCLLLGIAVICLTVTTTYVQAQTTRCDTACAKDESCSSNRCTLTRCSDTTSCYQYCLRCNDIETCYGTGPSCDYSGNTIQNNSSTQKTYSIFLAIFSLALLCISKWGIFFCFIFFSYSLMSKKSLLFNFIDSIIFHSVEMYYLYINQLCMLWSVAGGLQSNEFLQFQREPSIFFLLNFIVFSRKLLTHFGK